MTGTRWPLAVLAMIALAVLLSACGSGTATGSSDGTASRYEQAVRYAQCIRTHGDPNFADPNSSGQLVGGISVSEAVWQKATTACQALAPAGSESGQRTPGQQSAALKFAVCVRAHGVSDFPDPVNGQPLIDTVKIPSASQPGGRAVLHAAIQKCKSEMVAVIGNR